MGKTFHVTAMSRRETVGKRRALLNLVDNREARAIMEAARAQRDDDFIPLPRDARMDVVDFMTIVDRTRSYR